jgi:hypothetical protein
MNELEEPRPGNAIEHVFIAPNFRESKVSILPGLSSIGFLVPQSCAIEMSPLPELDDAQLAWRGLGDVLHSTLKVDAELALSDLDALIDNLKQWESSRADYWVVGPETQRRLAELDKMRCRKKCRRRHIRAMQRRKRKGLA